jgi:hypothetical protein
MDRRSERREPTRVDYEELRRFVPHAHAHAHPRAAPADAHTSLIARIAHVTRAWLGRLRRG